VEGVEDKGGDVAGYMPLQRQAGFIYDNPNLFIIAHELGHGAFNLRHTFSLESFIAAERTTQNLMDYPSTGVTVSLSNCSGQAGTELWKHQWEFIRDPQNIWFAWSQDEGEGEMMATHQINLVINKKIRKSGETYVTLYTNKELEIKIESSDTTFRYDKIKWQLEGNDIPIKAEHPEKISIKISPVVLLKEKNKLVVLDSLNKKIIDIEIRVYHHPYIVFDRKSTYKGEFLFDKGFEFTRLAKPEYYDTLHVGVTYNIYYAPVLGLNLNQTADINISKKDFPSFAKDDENFKVVIKASQDGFVKINGTDSLVLDANAFNNLSSITIKSEKNIGASSLHIYAYIPSINKKIGLLEYYCRAKEVRTVHLIYVKFKDESRYPSLDHNKLQNFLNTYSFNQLFLEMVVDTVHLGSSYKTTDFSGKISAYILQLLKTEKYGFMGFPAGIEVDYYFITNFDRGDVGGFHQTGDAGGVQTLWKGSAIGETQEEVTAHELGHWQGLPHTFRAFSATGDVQTIPAPFLWVTENEKGTRDNFMDYSVIRKTWFKFHLLNIKK